MRPLARDSFPCVGHSRDCAKHSRLTLLKAFGWLATLWFPTLLEMLPHCCGLWVRGFNVEVVVCNPWLLLGSAVHCIQALCIPFNDESERVSKYHLTDGETWSTYRILTTRPSKGTCIPCLAIQADTLCSITSGHYDIKVSTPANRVVEW